MAHLNKIPINNGFIPDLCLNKINRFKNLKQYPYLFVANIVMR